MKDANLLTYLQGGCIEVILDEGMQAAIVELIEATGALLQEAGPRPLERLRLAYERVQREGTDR